MKANTPMITRHSTMPNSSRAMRSCIAGSLWIAWANRVNEST